MKNKFRVVAKRQKPSPMARVTLEKLSKALHFAVSLQRRPAFNFPKCLRGDPSRPGGVFPVVKRPRRRRSASSAKRSIVRTHTLTHRVSGKRKSDVVSARSRASRQLETKIVGQTGSADSPRFSLSLSLLGNEAFPSVTADKLISVSRYVSREITGTIRPGPGPFPSGCIRSVSRGSQL